MNNFALSRDPSRCIPLSF